MKASEQDGLFGDDTSIIEQLLLDTQRYRRGKEYLDLLNFVGRLPNIAPFNGLLIHIQNPDVKHVATARVWYEKLKRTIRSGAKPLIVLKNFGPVEFVYDITDTLGEALPPGLLDPFSVKGKLDQQRWDLTIGNCWRDGTVVVELPMGVNEAGAIGPAEPGDKLWCPTEDVVKGKRRWQSKPATYRVQVNSLHSLETRYVTLVHELAHLYCGHLGTPNPKWWPDRRGCTLQEREVEAESVAHVVSLRIGLENPAARYLSGYMKSNDPIPPISIESVMKAARIIETMGTEVLPNRRTKSTNVKAGSSLLG